MLLLMIANLGYAATLSTGVVAIPRYYRPLNWARPV
jgi:hypothetical protein